MSRVPGTFDRTVRSLYLVPSPTTPGLTAAERLALTIRRDATISGRCACGATMPKVRYRAGAVMQAAMAHADDCPAAGPHLDRMAERLGDELQFDSVVVDLVVAS